MSKLLFDEQPLIISRELAKLIGLNEAIVLQQVHYWIEINRKAHKNFHNNRYWTYNSIKNWHKNDFAFWSHNTVQRTFASLVSKGFLIVGNYNRQKFDQTKWYSIDYKALEALNLPITPNWDNGSTQNGVMENTDLGQPIPEINSYNTSYINIPSHPIQSVLLEEPEKEKTEMIRCDKRPTQLVKTENRQKNLAEEPEKEKTEMIRCDKRPTQLVKTENRQKKEGFKNATATSSKHLKNPQKIKYSVAEVEEKIKKNIDYNYILMDDPDCKKMLDGVLHVIVSTIATDFKDGYISMGNEHVPADVVRSVFFELTKEEIEYFIENFNRQTNPTIKLTPYIRTSLFRNHRLNDFYWKNRVHVDMPQLAERKIQSKTVEKHY